MMKNPFGGGADSAPPPPLDWIGLRKLSFYFKSAV